MKKIRVASFKSRMIKIEASDGSGKFSGYHTVGATQVVDETLPSNALIASWKTSASK